MYRQRKYIAAFLAQIPCKACFVQKSELNNALSWSVNIEKYYPINGSWMVCIWRESPHYQEHDARTF